LTPAVKNLTFYILHNLYIPINENIKNSSKWNAHSTRGQEGRRVRTAMCEATKSNKRGKEGKHIVHTCMWKFQSAVSFILGFSYEFENSRLSTGILLI
jgi:uncharacterized protein YcsI (UPF0317 family)